MRIRGHTTAALTFLVVLCSCARAKEEPAPVFVAVDSTGVTNVNALRPTEEFNIVEYLYYYNGGGVAATDISGDGLPDLYFTNNQGPNAYYINEGNWSFREATEAAGAAGAGDWSTGVSVTDVNGDGRPDIYVCNVSGYAGLQGRNELFVQQSDGRFTEAAADYGLAFAGFNTQAYWFDYDLDGDQDMYLLRHSVHDDATYRDADQRYVTDSLSGDRLLRNEGRTFTDVTATAGLYSSKVGYGLSAAIADYDGNGYPDIYVCNDFSENDYLYLNDGRGGFRERVRERMGHTSNFSMGSDVGDLDGDGLVDLLTLDMRPNDEQIFKSTVSAEAYNLYRLKRRAGYYDQLPRNNVQWNRGGGHFSEIGELSGLAATDWSWSVLIEDLDLDTHPEVFVANGIVRRPNDLDYLRFVSTALARQSSNLAVISEMPPGEVSNQTFRSVGPLRFHRVDLGLDYPGSSTGAAVADLDLDGDNDLVINNVNAPAVLYRNGTLEGGEALDILRAGNLLLERRRLSDSTEALRPLGKPDRELRWEDHGGTVTPPRYCAQRGFQSHSAASRTYAYSVDRRPRAIWSGDRRFALFGPSAAGSEKETAPIAYRVWWADSTITESVPNTFDREPLQPFPGAIPGPGRTADRLSVEGPNWRLEADMWAPLRILEFADGDTTETVLPDTEGWWQSLSLIRGGEHPVVIAGNWGLNSSLGAPTPAAPLRLYLEDLDGNGRPDPIITYLRDGEEYTLADKDELAGQLPAWRRNNLSYRDFSRRDFAENFPTITAAPLVASTLAHLRIYRAESGAWRVAPLPAAAQITTLNAAEDTPAGILLGGNHLDVLPRVGRQDAAALQLWGPDGKIHFVDLGNDLNRARIERIEPMGEDRYRLCLADGRKLMLALH